MPLPSDGIITGQPIIAGSFFPGATLDESWQNGLSSIGTSPAIGASDGTWKNGFFAHNLSLYGTDWGKRGVINFERQKYATPDEPHPDGWSPYSLRDGHLVITSSLIDQGNSGEVAWGTNKTYHLLPDGRLGRVADFVAANGFPNGVPTNWGTASEEGPGGNVRFSHYPMRYKSGMLSTFGDRHSAIYFRMEVRFKMPVGAAGGAPDVMNRRASFPAPAWCLQQIHLGLGVNGEPTNNPSQVTYTPFTNSGKLTELDLAEGFGEKSGRIHHTVHYHQDTALQQMGETIDLARDLSATFTTVVLDVTPERIGMAIDGNYTFTMPTPIEMQREMPVYETEPGKPYAVVRDSNGYGVLNGELQRDANGNTKRMRFAQIINLARDGKYPRDLARQFHDAGLELPFHADTQEVEIDFFRVSPLVDTEDDPGTGGGGGPTTPPVVTPDIDPQAPPPSIAFDDTFKFRVIATYVEEAGEIIEARAEVIENPHDYTPTYTWTHNIPDGITVDIEFETGTQTTYRVDGEIDISNAIVCTATQADDGKPRRRPSFVEFIVESS